MIKSKYLNHKTTIDGITFASIKESVRYQELKEKQNKGEIKDLKLQVPFILQDKYEINGRKVREIKYICDFKYYDNIEKKEVIEDIKASRYFKTDVYKLKKKLFEYKYGIEIKEVY